MMYRAALCTALTGPDALRVEMCARLPLETNMVRIKVAAAALGFPDLLMTRGGYQLRLDPPFVPGMEIAGTVIEVADDSTGFRIGDPVMAGTRGGGLAEEVMVAASSVKPLPPALSFEEGAAFTSGAITAHHALVDKAQVQPQETVLILGAAGGVGIAAIQLSRHLGAMVIGSGSTAQKRAAILSAGAHHAVDPAAADFVDQIKALTNGKGADVIFDPVGGDLAIAATRAIAWGGRYLIVGFTSGTIPSFPANHALIKGYSIMGLRAGESGRRDPALGARNASILADYAAKGIMRPHIAARFSLDQASDALKMLESRSVIGRAVVLPQQH
jgi:NADPH:quinone reductase